jgi:hypothetical protein
MSKFCYYQGYFICVFLANSVEAVFAALQLNPVMNLMCLPLALVVSTIAASTVFRNVFVAHDGWVRGSPNGTDEGRFGNVSANLPRFAKPRGHSRFNTHSYSGIGDTSYTASGSGSGGTNSGAGTQFPVVGFAGQVQTAEIALQDIPSQYTTSHTTFATPTVKERVSSIIASWQPWVTQFLLRFRSVKMNSVDFL